MKNNESKTSDLTKEDIDNFNRDRAYVYIVHDNLLKKLFGFVPENPGDYYVERKIYTTAIKDMMITMKLKIKI